MTSNARAQRLVDEFKEGAAFPNGHSIRHGIAAVLRHIADTEDYTEPSRRPHRPNPAGTRHVRRRCRR